MALQVNIKICTRFFYLNCLHCFNCWQASHCVQHGIQITNCKQCCILRKVEYWSSGSIACVYCPIQDYWYTKVLHLHVS